MKKVHPHLNKITALALCIYGDISNYIWTLFCFNFFLFLVFILFFHQRSHLIELGLQIENVDRVVIQFIFVSNGVRGFLYFYTVILNHLRFEGFLLFTQLGHYGDSLLIAVIGYFGYRSTYISIVFFKFSCADNWQESH